MNPAWSSSFTKINPTTKQNETFQTNILQEFLRTNGLHLNGNQNIFKNLTEITTNENFHSEKKLENEIQETHVQMTSKSVTRLQGENITENTSVFKMYSKTTLKEKELCDNKLLKEEEGTVSFRRNETHKENDKLKSLYSWTEEKSVSPNKKEKNQFPVKEIRNAEDRVIGDAFLSYPPEIVEIYFSKKDKRSISSIKEDDDCCASNSGESVFLFSRINSRNIGEDSHIGPKMEESDSLNKDTFAEPTRDRQNFINLNGDYKFEKIEECLNNVENCVNSKINKRETEECKDVKEEKCSSDELKLQKLKDGSVTDKITCCKDFLVMDRRNFNPPDNLHSLENEKFIKIEEETCKEVEKPQRPNDNEQKLNTKSNESHKTENANFSAFEQNILTNQTENQNICSNSIFAKAETTDSNKISVKSTENEISKSSITSDEFRDSKFSKTELLSKENVKIASNEEKLNCKEEDSVANSLKENKMKTVVEKRENKKDNSNKSTTNDDEINSFNKDVQLTSIISDKKGKKENFQDSPNEITGIEIEDPKSGMIAQKTTRINDNYKHSNICKMLTSIHEQLTYDLQRMKRMEAKLLGKVSTDSNNHTMALQLLDKTVARCKSYIHGSNNIREAESEIIKIYLSHGIELMIAVNKNKAALDEQERRINEMQFETLHGRNANNKKSILKEINLSWNFWKEKIIYVIEQISCLVKNVMANNNEEKENVKSLRKYKLIHRRTTNNSPTHETKPKSGSGRSKPVKINVFKKESPVETQISIASNSKNFVKPLSNSANREKGKIQNDAQTSEKKMVEKGRTIKESSQNKNRVISNQQPVWRPGGMVKIPSSNSATTLQKARTNVKEKLHLFTEHPREEKLSRPMILSKKKVSNEVSSMKNMLSSNTHSSKITGKRSNTSLRISPRMKPKPGTLRAASKNFNESVRQISGYPNSNRSSNDTACQKNSKDSKTFSTLKEIIKSSEMNGKEEMYPNNIINSYQFPLTLETPSELILSKEKKEEIPVNREEPTRDVDSNKYVENYIKSSNMVDKNHQTVEKISDTLLTPKKALDLSRNVSKRFENHVDVGINTNRFPTFVSVANCTADFSSNSEYTTKFEVSSRLISSSSIQNREKRVTDGSILSIHDEEKQKDGFMGEKEKIRKNSHALSLNVLKEFLCEQGIDTDFVNRAERELKVKQSARRNSKKKSISFADMIYSVEDESSQKNLKNEHAWKKQEGNGINCEKNVKCEDNHIAKDINYEGILKNTKEDVIDCGKSLKYMENISNCEKNIKFGDNHIEKDINCEKNDKGNSNNCEKSLRHTENYKRNIMNSDENFNHSGNIINCEKSIKHAARYEENDINFKKNFRYTENQEEDKSHCEQSLQHRENHEENDINLKKNVRHTENQKEDNSNCQNNLKHAENHKGDNSHCEHSLKYLEDHQQNNINCENHLKYPKTLKENVSVPQKLKESEHYKKSIVHLPQMEMKDASSCTDKNTNDASSQTNFQGKSLQTLQTIPKHLRAAETQTETTQAKHVRNLINEVRNVSSMTDTFPVRDNFTETTRVSCVSKSVSTEQMDYVFSNNFNKYLIEAFTNDSNESCTKMVSNENSPKRCRNFFRQLSNQIQEKCNECSNCEENDASKELRFVESNASTLYTPSGSSLESLKNDEKMMKEANTSPIRSVSSETMVAFHVAAIRIRNIYRAIDIYKQKLRNKPKKTEERLSKSGYNSFKEKPSYVSKSSSVDTIFKKRNDNDENNVVRIYEELRQAEVESTFNKEYEDEDSESIKSSLSTTWSYESTFGKVELKLSGKLSDTIVLKDVKPLIDSLVQKTEDSMLEKKNSTHSTSDNECTMIQNNEIVQFSMFSRENLLPLVYGVMCCVVFWCLRFTVTCDTVS